MVTFKSLIGLTNAGFIGSAIREKLYDSQMNIYDSFHDARLTATAHNAELSPLGLDSTNL